MTINIQRIPGTRIVAKADALDTLLLPSDALMLRIAADEAFVTTSVSAASVDDAHAIVVPDSSFAGAWVDETTALDFLQRTCEWRLPEQRPAFAQGMVAGLPMKLWFETDSVLLMVPAPYATDFQERFE